MLPSSTVATFNCFPTCRTSWGFPLNAKTDVRATTRKPAIFDSSDINSSVAAARATGAPGEVLFRKDGDRQARCPEELAHRRGLDRAAGDRLSRRFGCLPLRAEEFHAETGQIDCRAAFPGPESDEGPGVLLRWNDRRVNIRTVENRWFARRSPNIGFCIQGET